MKTVPLGGGRLAAGRVALVDDEDFALVSAHRWRVYEKPGRDGPYAMTSIRRPDGRKSTIRMHQVIMGATGIDHIDGNGLNNQRVNLRLANDGQNQANRPSRAGVSSQYKGVSKLNDPRYRDPGWTAGIKVNGKSRFLGRFPTEEEAARAYDLASLEAWGEFARLNFPA